MYQPTAIPKLVGLEHARSRYLGTYVIVEVPGGHAVCENVGYRRRREFRPVRVDETRYLQFTLQAINRRDKLWFGKG